MNRRTLLALLGATSAGLAGCTDAPRAGTDTPSGPTATPTETPANPFAGAACPSFEDADRTVCWHTAEDEPIYLSASTAVFEPSVGDGSVEPIEFVLHNDSEQSFGLNQYAWAIKRQTKSGWEHVAPEAYPEPWLTLEPGETYRWRLSVEERSQVDDRTTAITQDLPTGTYAFQITGIAGQESTDSTRVECIALFEVNRQ